MIINEMTLWLFGTAVVFTIVGWFFGRTNQVQKIVDSTVDALIKEGYLKTRHNGKEIEILKYYE